jgi:hypothetical protein
MYESIYVATAPIALPQSSPALEDSQYASNAIANCIHMAYMSSIRKS